MVSLQRLEVGKVAENTPKRVGKALLVSGARQVGKTFAIRKVGKECFADVVEFNSLYYPIYMLMYLQPEMIKKPIFRFEPI